MVANLDGGNLYNKYESKNPFVKLLIKNYFNNLSKLLIPVKDEISSSLDIGCGEGYVSQYMKNLGFDIEGADISKDIIDIAKYLHPDVPFDVKSIYNLVYYNKRYDLVMAVEVLEHLNNPEQALKELKKVSNKYVFISVPNEPLFRICNMLRFKYVYDFGNTPGHINHWTKRSFKLFLSNDFDKMTLKTSTLWLTALCEVY
jgi:2-polyprenyl-3-methyl-5-hydroxy-6-metoxy-1,4-benzoquinol methylase